VKPWNAIRLRYIHRENMEAPEGNMMKEGRQAKDFKV